MCKHMSGGWDGVLAEADSVGIRATFSLIGNRSSVITPVSAGTDFVMWTNIDLTAMNPVSQNPQRSASCVFSFQTAVIILCFTAGPDVASQLSNC